MRDVFGPLDDWMMDAAESEAGEVGGGWVMPDLWAHLEVWNFVLI